MVEDGYTNIVCGDISRVVIAQLKIRCEAFPEISYFQGTMLIIFILYFLFYLFIFILFY